MANPLPHVPVLGPGGFGASEWQRWFDQLQRSAVMQGTAVTFSSLAVTGPFGANGATPQPQAGFPAAAVDLPTVIALANSIRAALIANGIGA